MFTIAAAVTLVCLGVPVSIFVRMVVTGRRVRAEIHAHMAAHRRTCCGPAHTNEQDAAPSAKTTAAPCHPAPFNEHEVSSS